MSEGPISAAVFGGHTTNYFSPTDSRVWWQWTCSCGETFRAESQEQCVAHTNTHWAEHLNALIAPLMQAAAANAAAEMRETCAEVIANEMRLREMDHDAGGHAMCHLRPIDELEQDIRALPLPPASDAWLRRVVECTASRLSNADKAQRELWVNHEIASILAEAAKEKP